MRASRLLARLLIGVGSMLATSMAFSAGAIFQPFCNSNWSDGTCWINSITTPPSNIPPVAGEDAIISPLATVTLDVGAQVLGLSMLGTMNQATNSVGVDNVLLVA